MKCNKVNYIISIIKKFHNNVILLIKILLLIFLLNYIIKSVEI